MDTDVTIGGYPFVCVPLAQADFSDVAAIYVILCVAQDRSWTVLDVGQSGQVGSRIDDHDRRGCWERNCPNRNIWVCAHRMPSAQHTKQKREQLESALRAKLNPKCGKR
ncbi:MAG: hypothetical protein RDU41_00190 [Clostridia bacterium]|nr:hypothetical protein [Clostridia bacterium]